MNKLDMGDITKLIHIGERTIELGELYIKLAKAKDEEETAYLTGKILMLASELQRLGDE